MNDRDNDKYMTPKEVIERFPQLAKDERILANWRHMKRGPKYCKVVGKIMYREMDIIDFLENSIVDPEAEKAQG